MPRVTVVVPAFQAASTLRSTLDSVAGQTYRDFEVVVVDDGSDDGTAEVADRHPLGVHLLRQPNAGVSAARNAAIEGSDSDLVAFLDADDQWEASKLDAQVALFDERPAVGVNYCGVVKTDASGRTLAELPGVEHADPCSAMLLTSSIMALSAGMVRREALDGIRFNTRFSQCADWDFWLRLSLRTRFAAVPEPLVRYLVGPANMSANVPLLERDTFGVLDAFYAEEPRSDAYRSIRRRVYSNHWMILGGSYLHVGRPRDAVRCVAAGLRLQPSNIGRPAGMPSRAARRLLRRVR